MAAVLKTARGFAAPRGFESHALRPYQPSSRSGPVSVLNTCRSFEAVGRGHAVLSGVDALGLPSSPSTHLACPRYARNATREAKGAGRIVDPALTWAGTSGGLVVHGWMLVAACERQTAWRRLGRHVERRLDLFVLKVVTGARWTSPGIGRWKPVQFIRQRVSSAGGGWRRIRCLPAAPRVGPGAPSDTPASRRSRR